MDHYIGKLLDNRYEILEVIGTGGMARVYRARCHRLNRLVAIKILREDLAQDAEFRRRFHDESQAIAMLSHPNIVAVYDVSRSSDLEYIVMELIDGITLKQYMNKKGGKLNWREALHFITQIVKALGHAHSRGIIHRDIKPQNVMVLRDGSVKVSDFGIARVASGGHSTLTQEALGSVHYISPEQARGSYIDTRSDLYSAGVVLYEMITGRLPFEGDTPVSVAIQHINSIPLSPRELDPSIPDALESITMKAMSPDPDTRYLSADEMLADLEEFRKNPNINFDYNLHELPLEEHDEDRTQVRPIPAPRREVRDYDRGHSRSSGQRGRPQRRYEDDEDEDDRRRGPVWPIVLSVLAILLFVGAVFYFLWNTILSSMVKPPETYLVPNVVGTIYEETVNNTELLDRFTLVLGPAEENEAPAGTILRQDPVADSEVGAAVTEITVTVSAGTKVVYMPDLTDMEYREAFLAIQNAELTYDSNELSYEHDDEVEKNHIISFLPLPDTPMAPGSKVQLVISLGPEDKPFPMPSFVDMTEEVAKTQITRMGLEVGSIKKAYSDTVAEGIVMDQSPAATEEVKEGDKVTLTVSQGPDPATQEPPEPPKPETVSRTVEIPLPASGEVVNLQVMMDGKTVHNEDYDSAMKSYVPINVSAPAGLRIPVIYFWDGVQSGSITVEF
ncbi:MAG: Stk1 family PASTA domain-containing Ser/Thr kinase [Lawsonibacter sp.]|nr:Stk1 family PASTA domain-containing Ser/Thr kinase [Lawsonibacter sp.]